MKFFFIIILFPFVITKGFAVTNPTSPKLIYEIDLKDISDDLLKLTLNVRGLKKENFIYQFAATAPGTYQIMDIGRYVRSFRTFDESGKELGVVRRSMNRFELLEPEKVITIKYTIAETWDTPVSEHPVFSMCGTSLEADHAFLNGQAVFGFLSALQQAPVHLKLNCRSGWQVGTALNKNTEGYYLARNYDELVDSPILTGELTKASIQLAGACIDIYAYSKSGLIRAESLLKSMKTMLHSAGLYMGKFPVKRYTFLFHFGDQGGGGWEHHYSSGYVIKEEPLTEAFAERITYLSVHEFLHIITPLHIHSDTIHTFNFVTPTASEHLWLYEGVTEWASHMMPLRAKMISLDTYFQRLSAKIAVDKSLDTAITLSRISLECYLPEGQRQNWNLYNRGAMVAGLLDIRLLELSGGKRGLREVMNELINKYGAEKPFPEKEFFTIFIDMTYPEIAGFINRYIKNAEALPVAEYYAKLGISYLPSLYTGRTIPYIGTEFQILEGKLYISKIDKSLLKSGLKEHDRLLAINGVRIDLSTPQGLVYFGELKNKLLGLATGESYSITVDKNGREETVACKILEQREVKKYVFQIDPHATTKQIELRSRWQGNLSGFTPQR